jgi:hypothetical protein
MAEDSVLPSNVDTFKVEADEPPGRLVPLLVAGAIAAIAILGFTFGPRLATSDADRAAELAEEYLANVADGQAYLVAGRIYEYEKDTGCNVEAGGAQVPTQYAASLRAEAKSLGKDLTTEGYAVEQRSMTKGGLFSIAIVAVSCDDTPDKS